MKRSRNPLWLATVLSLYSVLLMSPGWAQSIEAEIFPPISTVQAGELAAGFITLRNTGPNDAVGCTLQFQSQPPPGTTSLYAEVDPVTSAIIGPINGSFTIPAGGFVKLNGTIVTSVPFPQTEVTYSVSCTNLASAAILNITGLNTLIVESATVPAPSIAALTSAPNNNVELSDATATAPFLIASINLGATDFMSLSVNTNGVPVQALLCLFDVAAGTCVDPPNLTVQETISNGEVNFWAVFAVGQGTPIPVDPSNAIFVQWQGSDNVLRGLLRVTVHTQQPAPPNIFSGTWMGTWSSDRADQESGNIILNLTQTGVNQGEVGNISLTGTLRMEGSPSINNLAGEGLVQDFGSLGLNFDFFASFNPQCGVRLAGIAGTDIVTTQEISALYFISEGPACLSPPRDSGIISITNQGP